MRQTITRQPTTVRLPAYMLTDLHNEARRQGLSISRLIENTIEESLYQPNAETIAAIEEARSGAPMEELTHEQIEHFEEYVASL